MYTLFACGFCRSAAASCTSGTTSWVRWCCPRWRSATGARRSLASVRRRTGLASVLTHLPAQLSLGQWPFKLLQCCCWNRLSCVGGCVCCFVATPGQFALFASLNRGLAFLPGPLPGVGQVTLRAATLADEQMSDAEAASVCLVPLPYALPPTRYAASDVPWSIQEKPHEVQSVWD